MKKSTVAIISSSVIGAIGSISAIISYLSTQDIVISLAFLMMAAVATCIVWCVAKIDTNRKDIKIAEIFASVAKNETDKEHEYKMKALEKNVPRNSSPTPTVAKTKKFFEQTVENALFEKKDSEITAPDKGNDDGSSNPDTPPHIIRIK